MAKYKDRAARVERGSVVELPGDESAEVETGELVEQRENSKSGDREGAEEKDTTNFPVVLHYPSAPIAVYEHFSKAMDDFQRELSHSTHEVKHLTITQASFDAPVMPELHHSPYCGFRLLRDKEFSVRLSSGQIIKARKSL